MTQTTHHQSHSVHRDQCLVQRSQRRQKHLRHIHPMSREQQSALIEEARAARRVAQQTAEAGETRMLPMEPDQERTYRTGRG
jgi:hypothetical protein